jgi:hypothetical protein
VIAPGLALVLFQGGVVAQGAGRQQHGDGRLLREPQGLSSGVMIGPARRCFSTRSSDCPATSKAVTVMRSR